MTPSSTRAFRAFYRLRNLLAGLPLVVAFFVRWRQWEWELGAWSMALLLCAAGLCPRAWGISYCLYSHGRVGRLATGGPYRHVRNPLYLGNTLVIAGAVAASKLLWLIPLAAVWCIAIYSLATRDEERRLLGSFGDEYRRYRESVPAWFPRLRGLGPQSAAAASYGRILLRQSSQLLYLVPFLFKDSSF